MHLSLVKVVFATLQLLAITLLPCIDILVHIRLARRNIILEIHNIHLINKVIHFLIHALDEMVPDVTVAAVESLLHDALLRVLIEVPN